MALGKHKLEYEVLEGWDRLPESWSYVEVAGVACDSQDRVYVFNRSEHPVIVYNRDGTFIKSWGEGESRLALIGFDLGRVRGNRHLDRHPHFDFDGTRRRYGGSKRDDAERQDVRVGKPLLLA